MALMIGIFALLMYVFFESKRRQKIVPIIAPLKNESVSFVETVGRLYYNKGNHANLADKMIQQFLEWVRNNHMLNTNLLNDTFVQQLAMRTGQPETTVKELVQMIHETRLRQTNIDEAYLYQLYSTIQQFYKNHHKSYGTNRSYQHTRH
jgi:predicted DNA-binding ribbon-helix-helix protein